MKSFVAATMFALVRADCDSEDACSAQTTCSFDMGPLHCDVPNVKQACCDVFQIGVTCQASHTGLDILDCMQSSQQSLPPAEVQWMTTHVDAQTHTPDCPGIAQVQINPQQFCTVGTTASDLLPGQFSLMMAQQYSPEKPGPVVPGVIGFAIGAAVVTSVVAMQKKRNSADLYSPLAEETA
jgi:hypothetical protein